MALSDKQKIEIILRKKDEICKATDKISEILTKLPIEFFGCFRYGELTEPDSLLIRQELHKILSALSIIAGFLDKSSKAYVERVAPIVAIITSGEKISTMDRIGLEKFCTIVNSLIIDFNKRPWRFPKAFEIGLRDLFKVRMEAHK